MRNALILLALIIGLPGIGWAQRIDFYQGPGQVGRVENASGTVIGVHPTAGGTCYLILADRSPHAAGIGGAGRFFLCGSDLELRMNQPWNGQVIQVDTRLARIGPRWRPVSVFVEYVEFPSSP